MNNNFKLKNAEKLNRQHPETFGIPKSKVRNRMNPGSFAKLIFVLETDTGEEVIERMWVQIKGKAGKVYQGSLENEPFHDVGVHLGALVNFKAENIIQVLPKRVVQ